MQNLRLYILLRTFQEDVLAGTDFVIDIALYKVGPPVLRSRPKRFKPTLDLVLIRLLTSGTPMNWGVNLAQMRTPTAATQAYVDMLIDTALHPVR